VIGGSGLLGSAVRRAVATTGGEVLRTAVPWGDTEAAIAALLAGSRQLPESGWRLVWCAGVGVVGSKAEQLQTELDVVRGFLDAWQPGAGGAIFAASSAGGVYAGSSGTPFTEDTVPAALSPYGEAKLQLEQLFSDFSGRTDVPLLLGRISNLYGPGQDLGKSQGLVSMLCRAHLTGEPLDIYVSLDTMRDYLFVDDAAAMAVAGLEEAAARGGVMTKIFASGQSHTIAGVIGEIRRITRRRPPIVTVPSATSRFQVSDLRFRSVARPDLAPYIRTGFGAGIAACLEAVARQSRLPLSRSSAAGS
jgi:UDP-glucose 4-epimerase